VISEGCPHVAKIAPNRRELSESGRTEVLDVSEQQNRDTLERYIQVFERGDLDAAADFLHDDYVEEYPQSGERIRGKQNWLNILKTYPHLPKLIDYSLEVSGELCILDAILEYESNRVYVCEIFEVQDGKIKRAREYFGEPFEAPEWRAQWVERAKGNTPRA
jgi:limonene-1,2-epoxide hydrolase